MEEAKSRSCWSFSIRGGNYRLTIAPISRSHSSRLPRKPSSKAVLKLSLALILRRFPPCVVRVPIIAPRQEDVCRERVVFGFHCRNLSLNITDRRSEPFECIVKACRAHYVQSNITAKERQTVTGLRF